MLMRTESQVRQKLRQAVFRHRKREIIEHLSRVAANCSHNEGGYCPFLDTDCGPPRGKDLAIGCPHFENSFDKEAFKEAFRAKLSSPLAVIAREYPDVAALIWVLSEDESSDSILADDLDASSTEMHSNPSTLLEWIRRKVGGRDVGS